MLNYIKSEFYRTLRNRNLYLLIGICGLLMCSLVVVLKSFTIEPKFPYANTRFALSNIYAQMELLLMFTVVFAVFMHDNEDKQHTIKHSISFGIKRKIIYMARFLVQAIVSSIIYIVLVSVFTALSYGLLEHQNIGELQSLIRVSIGSCACLFAGLAITHFFLMNFESQNMAYVFTFSILIIIPSIFNLLGRKVEVVRIISKVLPFNVISYNGPLVNLKMNELQAVLYALSIGVIWMTVFLIWGVLKFNHKEVR